MAETTIITDESVHRPLSAVRKAALYDEVQPLIRSTLAGERDLLSGMCSVVCLLHHALPYFFWTGFYRRVGPELLRVGPYQGTLGCLEIRFGRGVCGAAARTGRTQIVGDVHAYPGHIACDARSASEIVVPVLDREGRLVAVLDVDSAVKDAFDDTDRERLEAIARLVGALEVQPVVEFE